MTVSISTRKRETESNGRILNGDILGTSADKRQKTKNRQPLRTEFPAAGNVIPEEELALLTQHR